MKIKVKSKKNILIIFLLINVVCILNTSLIFGSEYHMPLLAVKVTKDGFKGSTADLFLEIKPGQGRVFLDTYPLTKFRKTTDPVTRWHTIHWKLLPNNTRNLFRLIKNELELKQTDLTNQSSNAFFRCSNEQENISYEAAMMQNFICLECGEALESYDNSADVDELIARITILEKYLHNLHRE